jgi:hypothetical protein
MHPFFDGVRNRFRKNIERERNLDRPIHAFSRVLWPYPESKLVFYISILAVLDFVSTFAALELSGNNQVYESGFLAKWALQTGGFPVLFLVDVVSICSLICLAFSARALYMKSGFNGFGRAAFVLMLMPYFVVIMGVVTHNVLLSFL